MLKYFVFERKSCSDHPTFNLNFNLVVVLCGISVLFSKYFVGQSLLFQKEMCETKNNAYLHEQAAAVSTIRESKLNDDFVYHFMSSAGACAVWRNSPAAEVGTGCYFPVESTQTEDQYTARLDWGQATVIMIS